MPTRRPNRRSKAADFEKKRGARTSKIKCFTALNLERAESARAAVKAFMAISDTDYLNAIGDSNSNLRHLARQDSGPNSTRKDFPCASCGFEVEEEEARTNTHL